MGDEIEDQIEVKKSWFFSFRARNSSEECKLLVHAKSPSEAWSLAKPMANKAHPGYDWVINDMKRV